MSHSDVHFETISGRGGNVGVITLQRQNSLNSLTLAMFNAITQQLMGWAQDDTIKAVVIRPAPGRAFCAGGDLKQVYLAYQKQERDFLQEYFATEYRLNHFVRYFPKPYIALLDGITMGGGAGISVHGSHPVATENLVFGMPETDIGFYPDVGSSYFLSRLPGGMGPYLGLTGDPINAVDALTLGLIKDTIGSQTQDRFLKVLALTPLAKDAKTHIFQLLEEFSSTTPNHAKLTQHAEAINHHFRKNSVEEILGSLKTSKDDWSRDTYKKLMAKSPMSLKVTLELLKRGKKLDFDNCMLMEYHLTMHFIESHDFYEGIRAKLIDKDKVPKWRPAKLEEISEEDVARYFLKSKAPDLRFIGTY